MTQVQQRILLDLGCNLYTQWSDHNDMINITVPVECFLDIEEQEREGFDPGFNELMVIIEKDYLYGMMRRQGIADPHKYLVEDYSSDDAISWYDEALNDHKIVMVTFN